MKYLDVPLHHSRLRGDDLQPMLDKTLVEGLGGEEDSYPQPRGWCLLKHVWPLSPLIFLVLLDFPSGSSLL